jgi:hypothetical protein
MGISIKFNEYEVNLEETGLMELRTLDEEIWEEIEDIYDGVNRRWEKEKHSFNMRGNHEIETTTYKTQVELPSIHKEKKAELTKTETYDKYTGSLHILIMEVQ